MDRAYAVLDIKSVSDDERVIEGIASTPSPDRMDDIVEPMGAQFKTPMPLLWQHRHDKPVGQVEFAKATKDGIPFRARLASIDEPGTLKDRIDEAWQSVKAGLVRAVSIGFRPLEYSYIAETGGMRFLKWEWMELSLVTIPANADCSITAIKALDRTQLLGAARLVEPELSAPLAEPAAPGQTVHVAKLTQPARARAPFVIQRINRLR